MPLLGAHLTGRICEQSGCGGHLKNFSVDFGQYIPQEQYQKACTASSKLRGSRTQVGIVLGSSMLVSSFAELPLRCKKFVLVNLQETPSDKKADLKINGKIDDVVKALMEALGQKIPWFELKETFVVEKDAKQGEGDKWILRVRGKEALAPCNYIDMVEVAVKGGSTDRRAMEKDSEGNFSLGLEGEGEAYEVYVTFAARYKQPTMKIEYDPSSTESVEANLEMPIDPDNPPELSTVPSSSSGGLLDAIKSFPGHEYLQKGN